MEVLGFFGTLLVAFRLSLTARGFLRDGLEFPQGVRRKNALSWALGLFLVACAVVLPISYVLWVWVL